MDGGKPPFAQHGVTEHRSYMTDIGDISKRNDRSNIAKTGSQIVGQSGNRKKKSIHWSSDIVFPSTTNQEFSQE